MKFLNKLNIFKKLKDINHFQFDDKSEKTSNGIILIEFNSFYVLYNFCLYFKFF